MKNETLFRELKNARAEIEILRERIANLEKFKLLAKEYQKQRTEAYRKADFYEKNFKRLKRAIQTLSAVNNWQSETLRIEF